MASSFDKQIDKFLKETKEFTNMKRIRKQDARDMVLVFIEKMKEEIARGLSPLTRKKFPPYKNPEKYPGRLKPPRPVNLELTGAMLSDLKLHFIATSGKDIDVTLKYATRKSALKETGHATGANGQPKRPTLPGEGQNFSDFLLKDLKARFKALVEKFDV